MSATPSHNFHPTNFRPTNDYAFKKLFGENQNRAITAGLIKDFLGISVEPEEITFLKTTSIRFSRTRLGHFPFGRALTRTERDISIELKAADVTIEIQVLPQSSFIKRSIFYLAQLYLENYDGSPGRLADGKLRDRFTTLKPVWGLNILDFNQFPDDNPYRVFELRDEATGKPLSERLLRVSFFEIPKQLKRSPEAYFDGAAANRQQWAKFFRHGCVSPDAPSYIAAAAQIMENMNSNPKEAAMLSARQQYIADRDAQIVYAKTTAFQNGFERGEAEGHATGHATGLATGLAEGVATERVRLAKSMLEDGVPIGTVVRYAKLSLEDISKLVSD